MKIMEIDSNVIDLNVKIHHFWKDYIDISDRPDVGDNFWLLMIDFRYWCQEKDNVSDKNSQNVSNTSEFSPMHLVSSLRYQH